MVKVANRWADGAVRVVLFLLKLLIVVTPVYALLVTFGLYEIGLVQFPVVTVLLKAAKEILIVTTILLIAFWQLVSRKRIKTMQWLVGLFCLLSLLITWLTGGYLEQVIWGARVELLWLLFGAMVLKIGPSFSGAQKKQLLKWVKYTAMVVLSFGGLLMILGHEILQHFGYANNFSEFGLNRAPSFCQKEGGTDFCRLQAAFSGPNRYAAYLLALLPLFVWQKQWVWLGVLLLSVLLTLSQGAWVAIIAIVVAGGFFLSKLWKKPWFLLATGTFLVVCVVGSLAFLPKITEQLDESTSIHVQRSWDGMQVIMDEPLGQGLAHSGPATYRVGLEFIPESWFLQVGINQGALGLVMFIGILGLWLQQVGWFAGIALLLVALQNLFLHTWEDPGVYVTMFVVMLLLPKRIRLREEVELLKP